MRTIDACGQLQVFEKCVVGCVEIVWCAIIMWAPTDFSLPVTLSLAIKSVIGVVVGCCGWLL